MRMLARQRDRYRAATVIFRVQFDPVRPLVQVTSRLNYVLWTQDLLASHACVADLLRSTVQGATPSAARDHNQHRRDDDKHSGDRSTDTDGGVSTPSATKCHPSPTTLPVILDIGTGSSCIYPLIGTSSAAVTAAGASGELAGATAGGSGVHFFATDIDAVNAHNAARHVAANGLQHSITVLHTGCNSDDGADCHRHSAGAAEFPAVSARSTDTKSPTSSADCLRHIPTDSLIRGPLEWLQNHPQPSLTGADEVIAAVATGDQRQHCGGTARLSPSSAVSTAISTALRHCSSRVDIDLTMCNPPFFGSWDEACDSMGGALLQGRAAPPSSSATDSSTRQGAGDAGEAARSGNLPRAAAEAHGDGDGGVNAHPTSGAVSTAPAYRRPPPTAACTGAPIEMAYPGGEVAFIGRMVAESAPAPSIAAERSNPATGVDIAAVDDERGEGAVGSDISTRVRWFTSMVGKQSSLQPLMSLLKQHGARTIRTTELYQGRTARWCIAWSYFPSYCFVNEGWRWVHEQQSPPRNLQRLNSKPGVDGREAAEASFPPIAGDNDNVNQLDVGDGAEWEGEGEMGDLAVDTTGASTGSNSAGGVNGVDNSAQFAGAVSGKKRPRQSAADERAATTSSSASSPTTAVYLHSSDKQRNVRLFAMPLEAKAASAVLVVPEAHGVGTAAGSASSASVSINCASRPLPPRTVRVGHAHLVATPSWADAAYIADALVDATRSLQPRDAGSQNQNSQPLSAAAPVPVHLDELITRIEHTLAELGPRSAKIEVDTQAAEQRAPPDSTKSTAARPSAAAAQQPVILAFPASSTTVSLIGRSASMDVTVSPLPTEGDQTAAARTWTAVQAWTVIATVDDAVLYTAEVQLLLPGRTLLASSPAAVEPAESARASGGTAAAATAVVATCLLSCSDHTSYYSHVTEAQDDDVQSSGSNARVAHNNAKTISGGSINSVAQIVNGYHAFERFSDRLKRDVMRVGRHWRRHAMKTAKGEGKDSTQALQQD